MNDEDSRDIAYLIVAAVALVGAQQLWTRRVQPWASEQLEEYGVSEFLARDDLWVDVVGVAVLVLPVVVLLFLIRGSLRRRKKARQDQREDEHADAVSGPRGKVRTTREP